MTKRERYNARDEETQMDRAIEKEKGKDTENKVHEVRALKNIQRDRRTERKKTIQKTGRQRDRDKKIHEGDKDDDMMTEKLKERKKKYKKTERQRD